jgi:hypothetical protein
MNAAPRTPGKEHGLFSLSTRYEGKGFPGGMVCHGDRRNVLWSVGMVKRLLILIGWYWAEIANHLGVKSPIARFTRRSIPAAPPARLPFTAAVFDSQMQPSQQITEADSRASDISRVTQVTRSPVKLLKQAPMAMVQEAIKAAYDTTDAAGGKPPNIKELPTAVLPLLEQKGYGASARLIQELGGSPAFKVRRRSPGKTLSSERRARKT